MPFGYGKIASVPDSASINSQRKLIRPKASTQGGSLKLKLGRSPFAPNGANRWKPSSDKAHSLTAPAIIAGAVIVVQCRYRSFTPRTSKPPNSPPAEPSEYETFKSGLRQILSVPKSEIDRREAEWQKAQEQKTTRKKAA